MIERARGATRSYASHACGLRWTSLLLVFVWFVLSSLLAFQRSLWGDEMVRYDQALRGLVGGLRALYTEPSPFAPGETILVWLSGKVLGGVMPPEFWLRLPGLFWGASALAVAASMELRALRWFLFFSVSLTMFATEVRTYGSLIFSGVLACKILWDAQKPLSRPLAALTWFTLAFTHIYGICFVGLACFLRRLWVQAFFAGLYVVGILSQYHFVSGRVGGIETQSGLDILKQTLGTLGNPHKATFIFFPVVLVGLFELFRRRPRLGLEILCLLSVATLAPIAANIRAHFPFLPRQTLGGMGAYLALAALGFEAMWRWAKSLRGHASTVAAIAVVGLLIGASIVPWMRSVVLKQPPFPNQPMHRYREVAEESVRNGRRAILQADPCNETSFILYMTRALREEPLSQSTALEEEHFEGLTISKVCWRSGLCVYTLHDQLYCSPGAELFASGTVVDRFIAQHIPRFDLFVHGAQGYARSDLETRRSW